MKAAFAVMLFALSAFAQDPASSPVTAACGPKDTTFDVKRDATQHTLADPEPGKARVYFIRDTGVINCLGACITLKVGLDGAWVGALQDNSYFTLSVDPGEHHLCVNRQSRFATVNRKTALARFSAQPGKVYYYRALTWGGPNEAFLDLQPLDIDMAKYLITTYPLSIAHPK
jgi:hypothetical protein